MIARANNTLLESTVLRQNMTFGGLRKKEEKKKKKKKKKKRKKEKKRKKKERDFSM